MAPRLTDIMGSNLSFSPYFGQFAVLKSGCHHICIVRKLYVIKKEDYRDTIRGPNETTAQAVCEACKAL